MPASRPAPAASPASRPGLRARGLRARGRGKASRATGIWRGALLGVLSALGWRAVVGLGWMRQPENALQDAFFHVRQARFPHPAIVLVIVDDETVARAGVYPLPRSWHARVVESLARAGAKTIAFDILFSDASPSPRDDAALAQACRRAGNVVQAIAFWVPSVRNPEVSSAVLASPVPGPARFRVHEEAGSRVLCEQGVWATAPLSALSDSAVALGHLNAYPETDGVQRRMPPLIRYREGVYPSLPLAAAAHFLGLSPSQVRAGGRQVLVGVGRGQKRLDLDGDGEVGINWAGGYKTFPTYSYLDVLEGRVEPSVLKGRIVLIGSAAAGSYDQRATPLAAVQPGLEVHAGALNDILLNRPLRPPPAWLAEASILLLPIALGALVAALGGRRALGAGALAIAATLGASALAFSLDQIWPVATSACAMATALALVGASNYRRAWESSWRAQVAVETLARGGSLLSSATHFSRATLADAGANAGANQGSAARDFQNLKGEAPIDAVEAARLELARVAVQTLAQALGSPLVLWARDGQPPLLAATAEAGRQPAPLRDEESQALRLFAAQSAQSPGVRLARADASRPKGRRSTAPAPSSAPPQLSPQAPPGNAAARLVGAVEAAEIVAAAWSRDGRPLRVGQVLVAPLRHEAVRHVAVRHENVGVRHESVGARHESVGAARSCGVLLAFAPWHEEWGGREESLARAVVEQALLALENLEFTHALAGRVQAADRELQSAYEVVYEQSVKLREAIEGIADALIITDQVGLVTYANGATRHVLRQAAPREGQSAPQVLAEHGLAELARGFELLDSSRSAPAEGERIEAEATLSIQEGQAATERSLFLASQLVPLLGRDGTPVGAMLIVSDVTALREGDKMKTDFVAFVAHELRTPLTTIVGYASLLEQMGEQMEPGQREHMSGVIIQHCKRLNRMISELLDTARLDAGGTLSLRLEPLDLAALGQRMVQEFRHARSGDSRLSLEFDAPERPLTAAADADRVEQILTNLLSNAIKYSPDGGCVRLQVLGSEDGEQAILRVSDEGMGMSQEQLARLFEKFYRTPDALKRGIKGTGLGLFLARQLVLAHGGRIEVQSQPGQGATFSVFLPRTQQQSRREWSLSGQAQQ